MTQSRFRALCLLAILLVGVLVWNWIASWGLITVNFTDAPIGVVVKEVARQGGVRIVTNADPATKMTLQLKKAPLSEALNTMAARLDGSVGLAFVAGQTKGQTEEYLSSFSGNSETKDWKTYYYPSMGFGGDMEAGDDSASMMWKVSDMPEKNLQNYFDQGAQKTGLLFAVPQDWNPPISSLPSETTVRKVANTAVSSAKGKLTEVYLLRVMFRRERSNDQRVADYPNPAPPTSGPAPRGNRRNMNPEWMAERAEAQIKSLPPDEQKTARDLFAQFQALQALPQDERRAKFQELMQNPELREMMESRMESRDSRKTPEQRAQRFRNYLDRKRSAANPQT